MTFVLVCIAVLLTLCRRLLIGLLDVMFGMVKLLPVLHTEETNTVVSAPVLRTGLLHRLERIGRLNVPIRILTLAPLCSDAASDGTLVD